MKKEERNYTMYLQDLLVAMSRIAEYLGGYTFDQFKKDYKTVDAVIHVPIIAFSKSASEKFSLNSTSSGSGQGSAGSGSVLQQVQRILQRKQIIHLVYIFKE